MKLAIMQPTYAPWIGYFDLIDQVDGFVFLDQVEFSKQSWQQRNRIKTPRGLEWLTVPVNQRLHQKIIDVEIRDPLFGQKHLRTIQMCYSRAPYYAMVNEGLTCILGKERSWHKLCELNVEMITWISRLLDLKTPLYRSMALGVEGKRVQLLARICEKLGCNEYLSPLGSSSYLLNEKEELIRCGVRILFQHYNHPTYSQLHLPFIPYASVLDLLFNQGPRSREVIVSGRAPSYSAEEYQAILAGREETESHERFQDRIT